MNPCVEVVLSCLLDRATVDPLWDFHLKSYFLVDFLCSVLVVLINIDRVTTLFDDPITWKVGRHVAFNVPVDVVPEGK